VPRIRRTFCASTPRRRCRRRSAKPLSSSPTRSALVVSHHLDGLLRAEALGLLHPRTGRGSLRFATSAPHVAGRSRRPAVAISSFRATRFTPFEEFPSPAAVPRRRGRCPLAVLDRPVATRAPKHSTRLRRRADKSMPPPPGLPPKLLTAMVSPPCPARSPPAPKCARLLRVPSRQNRECAHPHWPHPSLA